MVELRSKARLARREDEINQTLRSDRSIVALGATSSDQSRQPRQNSKARLASDWNGELKP